jgi:flagella synthesis protein FlgN
MTISTTLADEQQLLQSLVELLQQEQGVLVAADADRLEAITPKKSQLVQQLAARSVERHRELGDAGFEAGEAGMAPWLDAQGDAATRAQWTGLLELTREAKELNRLNGMLINKQMVHNQQVLGALRAGGDDAVYGPGGQTVGNGPSKKFVVG